MIRRLALVCPLAFAACASVLGLGDEQDVAAALCTCDLTVPQFDGSCAEVVRERLESASESTRAAWLAFYVDNCAGDCGAATSCYQKDPVCTTVGRSCGDTAECCDNVEVGGTVQCAADSGTCQ